jgi:hypothetical protein
MEMFVKLFGRVRELGSGKWGLAFLLLVSLAIKVALLSSGDIINRDGVRYIDAARQFAQGNFLEGLSIDWMPFYSLLIAGFHFLIRDWALAGQLLSLFSMVFALVPLYLLTTELFDEKVAFWTGLAFALNPMLNGHAVGLLRDPVFIFFVGWAVYFCLRSLRTGKILFFTLASLSATFAVFCRLEGILLWGVFLSVLAALIIKNRAERRLLFKGMAVFVGLPLVLGLLLGGSMLLVAGSDLTSFGQSGELTEQLKKVVTTNSLAYYKGKVSKGILDNYHSRYEKLKDLEKTLPGWGSNGNLLATTRHYLPLVYLFSAVEALARNLFPIFVIPLLAGFKKRPVLLWGHWFLVLLTSAYFLLAYYFLFTHDWVSKRYVLVPALLLLPWVGLGVDRFRRVIAECRWPRIAMVVFLLVFCGAPAYKSLEDFSGPGKGNAIRKAGQWLSLQPDLQNAVIACSDPRVRFYSSEKMKFLKEMEKYSVSRNIRKMESVAFHGKADLLVIEISKKERRKIPEFSRFSIFKEFEGHPNDVLIYSRKG